MTNFTGFIGLRIGYDHKVRAQNRQLRVEILELLKIDHKYSEARVNLLVEATIINIENRREIPETSRSTRTFND
jgi:hypothetical protein